MAKVSAHRVTRRTSAVAVAAALLMGVLTSVLGGAPAGATSLTKANTTPIAIPDSGNANPYPSTINVSGLGTSINSMKVVIRNINHSCVKDLDVLLVGPDGTKTTLFSDNGYAALLPNCADLVKKSLTIDDSCPDFGNTIPSGDDICVRPSDNDSLGHQGDTWTGVGSDFPALNLSSFTGKNPNGDWKFYVNDDSSSDSGSFAGGWELQFDITNSPPVANPQVITAYKGTSVPVALTGTDPDGDPLTCVAPVGAAPSKGALGGSGCARTYTAAARTADTDQFAYKVVDDKGSQSANAAVVFNITNRPPTATDQTITVGRNERVALTLGGTDPDAGEALALTCIPALGATTLGKVSGSGCNVTYAANNTNGSDSFAFTVADGFGGFEEGTVTITVADPVLAGCGPTDSKNARYICRVYLDLLGRAADPGGKAFWLLKVDKGESRVGIIRKYQTTPEYNRRVVDDVYKTFLKRNPDSGGQAYWADKVRKGANPDEIRAEVIGSGEYFTKSGGSSAGFAAAMYQQVTRTPATDAQINTVVAQIQAGKTRTAIAAALLATPAGDTATVQGVYERYLRRTPPASEVTYWVNKLQSGVTELKIVEATVSSNEYYNRS
jgi:subtilisin-like proprotein convertase family protein